MSAWEGSSTQERWEKARKAREARGDIETSGTKRTSTPRSKDATVVTLCGSTRFKSSFKSVQEGLALAGVIVLSCDFFLDREEGDFWDDKEMDKLHAIHLQKIKMSDAILVIDVDNYIGEKTLEDILYATRLRKTVLRLNSGGFDALANGNVPKVASVTRR